MKSITKYILLSFILWMGIACQKDEMSYTTMVETDEVTDLVNGTATCGGVITSEGQPTIAERGLQLSANSQFDNADIVNDDKQEMGKFTIVMTQLLPRTDYYVRAYAKNSFGTIYGQTQHFRTPAVPTVETDSVRDITRTSFVCGGNVTDDGDSTVTQRGLCWGEQAEPTIDGKHTDDGRGVGKFTHQLTDLTPGQTYYVRAYAMNAAGVAYGEQREIITILELPTLTTSAATNISYTSAILAGYISDDGGANVIERGICYNTSTNPTIHKITSGTGIGSFSVELSDLQDNTTYYVRAYAINAKGLSYGNEISFTTKAYALATVTTSVVANILYNFATCGGSISDDGGANVTERGICYSTSQNPTTSNTKVAGGTGKGTFSVNLSGLKENTTYYLRAYAINAKGTSYGNEMTFTTKACALATVTTSAVTNISYMSATCGGNISDDGGANVTERGICYSTSQNPTVSNTKVTSGIGKGSFSVSLIGLKENTTYYVRAYAINAKGTSYGNEVTITTKAYALATITTSIATNISSTTATCGGTITDDGGANVTERGICYSTSQNPTISNTKVTSGIGKGSFSVSLTGLKKNTTYYARAYAINAKGTSYGNEVTFTTNGHEWIDLGLSVKWATMNVGATTPEDYGYYFAWGETATKSDYSWSTYKYCKGTSSTLTKYCISSSYGTVDNKTVLEPKDDAAHVNWGGTWRMPTDAEWTELREQCTWKWTTQNGINGYLVTSKKNSNSIFLPASGCRDDTSLRNVGSYGYYWSSSLSEYFSYNAFNVNFYSSNVSRYGLNRYRGQSVRPVCP